MAEPVRYEVTDRVAVITIDRPEVKNAMDLATFDGIRECAQRADADPDAGAVLIRGADGAFSSGIDVSVIGQQMAGGGPLDESFIVRLQSSFDAVEDIGKPVLAAIDGPCFGAGIQLALACHVRAVAPSASLSMMEARWGLIPDLGGTHRLPRLVGLGRATELTLTARRVDATEALSMGLAEIELDHDDPHGDAMRRAAELARGPGALRRAPALLRANVGADRGTALAAERAAQLACVNGADFAEAVAARFERREPNFIGE